MNKIMADCEIRDTSVWEAFLDNLQIVIEQIQEGTSEVQAQHPRQSQKWLESQKKRGGQARPSAGDDIAMTQFIWEIPCLKDTKSGDSATVADGNGREVAPSEFDLNVYWQKLGDAFKAVSHEATKLSMTYCKPPAPARDARDSLLTSVQKSVLVLVTVYSNLPRSAGLTLLKAVKLAVKQIIENVKNLAETIKEYQSGSTEQYQNTGLVWKDADNFSTLPYDNKAAVCQVIDKNTPMVDDALNEITEALNCDEDDDGLDDFLGFDKNSSQNDQAWTESDRNMLQYCVGLVKCSKSVLKKTKSSVVDNGNCCSVGTVGEMDTLGELVAALSPIVDELVSTVYPPLQHHVMCTKSADLGKANKDILQFVKHSHISGEGDQKWVEFLLRANSHNMSKINNSVPQT